MSSDGTSAPIGILCALPEELRLYRDEIDRAASALHGGMEVVQGTLDGRRVVLVESGMGKVNSASAATVLIEHYGCDRLLLSGVAGALDPALSIGDVVVGTRVVQYDYGRVTDDGPTAFQPGAMPVAGTSDRVGWPLRADLLAHVQEALKGDPLPGIRARSGDTPHVPIVRFGPIATGDVFVASERLRQDLLARFDALAVDMESGAMVQVAERYGAGWLVVRAVSDLAGREGMVDFSVFLDDAAHTAAALVRRLVPIL
ncbi:MAG: 5'-methylthioadenosine/adenosylhomocysteine nucleosidase [Chloroflexota bacterium]